MTGVPRESGVRSQHESAGRDCGRKRVCLVTTSPLIVHFFLLPHLASLGRTYRVSLAVNADEGVALPDAPGVEVISFPIVRKISPWNDLRALVSMVRLFRQRRFDAIHSFSPKAGLLATFAGWMAGVPVRIHTFTGQVWTTRTGIMRSILIAADKAIARFATHLLADSPSQRQSLIETGIVTSAEKCRVLGSGSVSGVDPVRFRRDSPARDAVRRELEVPADSVVFLFLGRLTPDKGVLDLAQAFARLAAGNPKLVLLMVGPDEENMQQKIEAIGQAQGGQLRFAGYTRHAERYVAAADVLCLPSYREGFGTAIIEAAAAGVPAIGSRIYGITDAIVEGETGLLHTAADADDLARKMDALIKDPALRQRLGERAQQRAIDEFSEQRLTEALLAYYRSALGE